MLGRVPCPTVEIELRPAGDRVLLDVVRSALEQGAMGSTAAAAYTSRWRRAALDESVERCPAPGVLHRQVPSDDDS